MSSNRDQLQALIADIDEILRKMNSRLAWWSSGETRRVLERVRLYLDGQLTSPGTPERSVSALQPSPIATEDRTEAAAAQAVLQGLLEDLTGLRRTLMQPLQDDIAQLRQERYSLMEEVRQLEQKQRHYSTLAGQQAHQQQAISDFLQALIGPLQDRLSQEVSEAIGHLETQLLTEGFPSRLSQAALESALDTPFRDPLHALTEENSGLLSPEARLEQLQMLQGESDRLLMSLDSTLRVVFEALERNVNSYNDSLGEGLDKMHRLGQQGELMFSALVNHLAQLLGQETSSYLQSSLRLLASTQSAIKKEVTPESDPEPAEPPAEPPTPQSSDQGSASVMTEAESRELLEFPFAGAELTPTDRQVQPEAATPEPEPNDPAPVTSPAPTARTREQMSQDNFEMAAQLAETSETDKGPQAAGDDPDDLFTAIGQEVESAADSTLDLEDLPELNLEEWVSPEETLSENWDLSASFTEETVSPPSAEIPQTVEDDDLFATSEEANPEAGPETSPYGEDDLFADLASRQDAPGMGEEYSEEYMDEFLFGDRLESLLTETNALSSTEVTSPEKTEPPTEPEPQAEKKSDPTDDLFADFAAVPEAIADKIPESENATASPTPSVIEDSLPELPDEAIAPDLDLAEDWDESVYIQASDQEDLLGDNDLEDDLDNLWLSNTGIRRLDEDLSKLEKVEPTSKPNNRPSPPTPDPQETELSAEQWLEDLAAEPPLAESDNLDNLEDLDTTLPWEETGNSEWDVEEAAFLSEEEESDPLAIALDSDFFNEIDPSPQPENNLTATGKPEKLPPEVTPEPSPAIATPQEADFNSPKPSPVSQETQVTNNVLPTLDDIFAELMATNPPPVVKVTAEADGNPETVADFFADFMEEDDEEHPEAIGPGDPESESEQPKVSQPFEDELANPTLDNFFESWSDAPNLSQSSSSRSDGAS